MNTRSGAVSELQAQHPIYEHIVLHSAICRALPAMPMSLWKTCLKVLWPHLSRLRACPATW